MRGATVHPNLFLIKHRKELSVNWFYVATYIVVSCSDVNARPVHVEFVADKSCNGTDISLNTTVIWTL
jgi:hypothetical protein